jgi:hypothetical protein
MKGKKYNPEQTICAASGKPSNAIPTSLIDSFNSFRKGINCSPREIRL